MSWKDELKFVASDLRVIADKLDKLVDEIEGEIRDAQSQGKH